MVNPFKRKVNWDKPFSEKIAKRVSKIPTGELSRWADQAIYEMGRSLSEYERNRGPHTMEPLITGAEALHAVVHELNKRMNSTL